VSNAVTSTGILIKRGLITPPAAVAITSNTADLLGSIVLTAAPHLLTSGDEATIAGVTGSTPTINGVRIVTVIDSTHYRVPVPTTVGGTGGTSQELYQAVGEVTDVTPGGMSRNKIDTSTHNDGTESNVLGILRQEDPGMKINYVGTDATHVAILADIAGNIKNNWRVRFPSGVSRSGQAFVQAFKFDPAPVDGKQGASIMLTWSGPVTEATS
jgi:tail tube protein